LDKRTRLVATIQGKDTPPILNDIGIFCKRSATLLRYSLFINDELFWKDGSDGLIISTPTGSTAYSMSVGGPVILHPSEVFSIIPVNSINTSRRPLIIPSDMKIDIRDLSSSVSIEAVLDGQKRLKVGDSPIAVRRAESDAVFVKFDEELLAALRGKLQRKTENYENLQHGLPPSAKLILKVLEYNEELTQKQIIEESMLPPRTVRYALSLLISDGLIKKHTSLRDSRQALYSLKQSTKKSQVDSKT
ncbi:MAG: MarR family transcriptional regulator, partial [Candidatus Thorarchaeota archaeon]